MWCQYDSEGQPREEAFQPDLVGDDGAHKAARFLDWAFLQNRPGATIRGKQVGKMLL
jgi:hypothetical protein